MSDEEKKEMTDFEKLEFVMKIYNEGEKSEKGYIHLTKNPEVITAHYEGRELAYKMIRRAMERIKSGEWLFNV
tara:strand:- start:135 stop:353 length:219 start_codon:yes stop_codon:yes gene_type:complete